MKLLMRAAVFWIQVEAWVWVQLVALGMVARLLTWDFRRGGHARRGPLDR